MRAKTLEQRDAAAQLERMAKHRAELDAATARAAADAEVVADAERILAGARRILHREGLPCTFVPAGAEVAGGTPEEVAEALRPFACQPADMVARIGAQAAAMAGEAVTDRRTARDMTRCTKEAAAVLRSMTAADKRRARAARKAAKAPASAPASPEPVVPTVEKGTDMDLTGQTAARPGECDRCRKACREMWYVDGEALCDACQTAAARAEDPEPVVPARAHLDENVRDALVAWCDRLIYGPKALYAAAYVEHLVDGAPEPEDPGTEWAAKVRRRAAWIIRNMEAES